MSKARFVAELDGVGVDSARDVWALRSAVVLGADVVRVRGPISEGLRTAAQAVRMPLEEGEGVAQGVGVLERGSLPSSSYLRTLLKPAECNLSSRELEGIFAGWVGTADRLPVDLYGEAVRHYRVPMGFDSSVWLTQLWQAEGAVQKVEEARFMGDSGAEVVLPLGRDALFSMLDPDGGWRVAQRRLREAMRPVAMATRFDAERSRLRLWVSTRRAEGLRAWTHWRVVRTDGMLLDEGGEPVTLEGCGRAEVGSVELSGLLREYSPVEVLVWTSLETEEGGVLWQGCTPLCETKYLQLADPSLSVEVEAVPARSAKGSPEWRHDFRVLFPEHDDEDETRRGGGHWFRITLTALAPTLWVELSTPGLSGIHFGENTFCLETESPKEILVRSARVLTLKAFRSALRVGNLFDLMTEDRS